METSLHHSFALDPAIQIDTANIRRAKQTTDWNLGDEHIHKGPILIQQSSYELDNVQSLLPYRSFIIMDCSEEHVSPPNITLSVNCIHTVRINPMTGAVSAVILVDGQNVLPGTTIVINGRAVQVEELAHTHQLLISLNQWQNIQNKSDFHGDSGVFSMFSENYEDYFVSYAQTLPFTQTTLMQLVALGSVLSTDIIPTTARELSSNFIDVAFCGDLENQRRCNGGIFAGKKHGGHAWNSEEHSVDIQRSLNNYFRTNKAENFSARVRTIVNRYGEYEDGIAKSHSFTSPPAACFVGTTTAELKKGLDNELPHELGHTYGLPDWCGANEFAYKHRSFQFNSRGQIVKPYFTDGRLKRGSMNGGKGDSDDTYFTQITAYGNAVIHDIMAKSSRLPENIHYGSSSDLSTLLFTIGADFFLYRLNAYLPPEELSVSVLSGDFCSVTTYDEQGRKLSTRYTAVGQTSMVILPADVSTSHHIIVNRPRSNIYKIFFVRNDALQLPPAIEALHKEAYLQSRTKVINTQTELTKMDLVSLLTSNLTDLRIELSDDAFISKLAIPAMASAIKTIFTIYNSASGTILVETGKQINLLPGKAILLYYRNGWQRTQTPNEPTYDIPIKNGDKNLPTTEQIKAFYGKTYKNLFYKLYDGKWMSSLYLPLLDETYVGYTIEIKQSAGYDVKVVIEEAGVEVLKKSTDAYIYKYTNGWTHQSFTFNNGHTKEKHKCLLL